MRSNVEFEGSLSGIEKFIKGTLVSGGVVAASAMFSVTMTAVLHALPRRIHR